MATRLVKRGHEVHVFRPDWDHLHQGVSLPEADGLIFMGSLGVDEAKRQRRVEGAFVLARAFGSREAFITISQLGGHFAQSPAVQRCVDAGLAGLCKTAALEWTGTRCLALDLCERPDVSQLIEALNTDHRAVEVALVRDQPVRGYSTTVTPLPSTYSPRAPIDATDLVVVSGGAKGVTAHVVRELARRWRPTLLLLGRSPLGKADPVWAEGVPVDALKGAAATWLREHGEALTPARLTALAGAVSSSRQIREQLKSLDAIGVKATYSAVDIRDARQVKEAIAHAEHSSGPTRMIIHGAGVIADRLIVDKSDDQFNRVFKTKVDGLKTLLAAVDLSPLKAIGLFSSVSGRYGNSGQSDYAMANEVLNATAFSLRTQIQVKSFDWGPWAGGMVNPALKAQFEKRGVPLIDLDAGAQSFCDEFESNNTAVEVIIGGPEQGGALLIDRRSGEARRSLSPKTSGLLQNHVINGDIVLPVALVLEWMVDCTLSAFKTLHLSGVEDFRVLKGVVVPPEGRELTLRWKETSPQAGADRSVELELLGDVDPFGQPVRHYRGTVHLRQVAPVGPSFDAPTPSDNEPYPYDLDDAYRRFLFHGPALRGIKRIHGLSSGHIIGQLDSSTPRSFNEAGLCWQTDPLTLDSALQLMVLWVRHHTGASALPSGFGLYQQFRPFKGPIECHITLERKRNANGRFDATFTDSAGRVVASVKNGEYAATEAMNDSFTSL